MVIDTGRLLLQIAQQIEREAVFRAPFHTGQLRKSLTSQLLSDTEAVVGTNLFYARFVHDGTGLYGPLKKTIKPVKKKALYWSGAAHPVKSVRGMAPQPFLAEALEAFLRTGPAPQIVEAFGQDVADAIVADLRAQGLEVKRT